ncbi:MAG: hypothetical protein WCL16_02730 [bacterium]
MRRQAFYALMLLALAVLVLILTKDTVNMNVLGYELRRLSASIVFFGWMVLGVIIGVLLK